MAAIRIPNPGAHLLEAVFFAATAGRSLRGVPLTAFYRRRGIEASQTTDSPDLYARVGGEV